VAVTVQATSWPAAKAPASVERVAEVEVAVTGAPSTVQAKDSVVVSASASVAEPVQVRVLARVGLDGVSEAITTGARFASVTDALPDALPPLVSDAVTPHAIASRDAAEALESDSVAPDPSDVPRVVLVHAYDSDGVPPSASVAVTEQLRRSSLYAEAGAMLTVPSAGFVFVIVAPAEPVALPPSASDAVAVHVITSPGSLAEVSVIDAPTVPVDHP
jgi:hypothetical protein